MNKNEEILSKYHNMIDAVKDYFAISPYIVGEKENEFICVNVFQNIQYNEQGDCLKKGLYFVKSNDDTCTMHYVQPVNFDNDNNVTASVQRVEYKDRPFTLYDLTVSIYEYCDIKKTASNAIESYLNIALGDTNVRNPIPEIKTISIQNDKVNKNIVKKGMAAEETGDIYHFAVQQASKKDLTRGKSVATLVTLEFDPEEIQMSRQINCFDMLVYNVISSYYYYCKLEKPSDDVILTVKEIWRKMNGKTGSENPSPKQIKEIKDSIKKMSMTYCTVNFEQEVAAGYMSLDNDKIKKCVLHGNLLSSLGITFTTVKGKTLDGYKILSEPILYTYNKSKNRLVYVDADLLDISGVRNATEYTKEFTYYLLLTVNSMATGNLDANSVLIDSIYKNTGIEAPETRLNINDFSSEELYKSGIRKAYKRDRDTIEAIFNSWIAKGKLIKGYKPVKSGNSIIGYDLDVIKEKSVKTITDKKKSK